MIGVIRASGDNIKTGVLKFVAISRFGHSFESQKFIFWITDFFENFFEFSEFRTDISDIAFKSQLIEAMAIVGKF